jgi:hypothetical protein
MSLSAVRALIVGVEVDGAPGDDCVGKGFAPIWLGT